MVRSLLRSPRPTTPGTGPAAAHSLLCMIYLLAQQVRAQSLLEHASPNQMLWILQQMGRTPRISKKFGHLGNSPVYSSENVTVFENQEFQKSCAAGFSQQQVVADQCGLCVSSLTDFAMVTDAVWKKKPVIPVAPGYLCMPQRSEGAPRQPILCPAGYSCPSHRTALLNPRNSYSRMGWTVAMGSDK